MIGRRMTVAGLLTSGVLVLAAPLAAAPASAGSFGGTTSSSAGCTGGGSCWNNLAQYVSVQGTQGYVNPAGGNAVPLSDVPPPACWMEPLNDMQQGSGSGQAVYKWWQQAGKTGDPNVITGIATASGNYPAQFAAHKNAKPGSGTWYVPQQNMSAPNNESIACVTSLPLFQWVPTGQAPQLPKLPPRDLALYALSKLQLKTPTFNLTTNGTNNATKSYTSMGVFVTNLQGAPKQPVTISATLNGVTGTVQVTNSGVQIQTPNARVGQTCGPNGTYWRTAAIGQAKPGMAPDCGALYTAAATGNPFTISVSWTATYNGQPIGPNPIQKTSQTHYLTVCDAEALNASPGSAPSGQSACAK